MALFYKNIVDILTTNRYFEEELNIDLIKINKLSDLNSNLSLSEIPENVIYTQGNEKYCLIRVNSFVYSFSFMTSNKIHDSLKSTLSLTFGLIKRPDSVIVGEVANLTKMASYRDSSTRQNVGGKIAKILWKNIISYFRITFPNNQMSYRSDLEAHEHAILSNLIDFLNKNTIAKKEIIEKIKEIKEKIHSSETYRNISADDGKSDYYAFSGSLDTPVEKQKIMKNILQFEKMISEITTAEMSKKDFAKLLSEFEQKNLIRTGLYTFMTKEIFGIKKIRRDIQNLLGGEKDLDRYLKEIKEKIKKETTIIINKQENYLLADEEIDMLMVSIKKIAESNSMNKIAEIENLVDEFYSNTIQDFDFLKNRYVMLKV